MESWADDPAFGPSQAGKTLLMLRLWSKTIAINVLRESVIEPSGVPLSRHLGLALMKTPCLLLVAAHVGAGKQIVASC